MKPIRAILILFFAFVVFMVFFAGTDAKDFLENYIAMTSSEDIHSVAPEDENVLSPVFDVDIANYGNQRPLFFKKLSQRTKEILGLDPNKDDTDGDGIPDVVEIAINSDPLEKFTEQLGYNDYDAYFKYGMYPPLSSRRAPDDLPEPPMPKYYKDGPTPSTFIRPAIVRDKGAPIVLEYKRLVKQGKDKEAKDVRRRAILQYVLIMYGEGMLAEVAEGEHPGFLMRISEDFPDYYGDTDTDLDGIPDLMEE